MGRLRFVGGGSVREHVPSGANPDCGALDGRIIAARSPRGNCDRTVSAVGSSQRVMTRPRQLAIFHGLDLLIRRIGDSRHRNCFDLNHGQDRCDLKNQTHLLHD